MVYKVVILMFVAFIIATISWIMYRHDHVHNVKVKNFEMNCFKSRHSIFTKYILNTTRGIVHKSHFQKNCSPFFESKVKIIRNQLESDYNIETLFVILLFFIVLFIYPVYKIVRTITTRE